VSLHSVRELLRVVSLLEPCELSVSFSPYDRVCIASISRESFSGRNLYDGPALPNTSTKLETSTMMIPAVLVIKIPAAPVDPCTLWLCIWPGEVRPSFGSSAAREPVQPSFSPWFSTIVYVQSGVTLT
jgi:hypothetical protein